MTVQTGGDRGRRESPSSRFNQGDPSSRAKAKAALDAVLVHPFWAQFPKALSDALDRAEQSFDKAEFDEALVDRVANALRLVAERGKFGEPEEAFLRAARAEFSGKKGFAETAIDFAQAVAGAVDPEDTKSPSRVRDHLDLVRFVYTAARDKPELLELLNDSAYKNLDPSVVNNPNLDKLLIELHEKGLLQHKRHIDAVRVMLSPLRANWTMERCDEARRLFGNVGYLENIELVALRRNIDRYRTEYPKIAGKVKSPAHALRLQYSEETVLRFEFVCLTMHVARINIHA
ncbi:hypothetical protein A3C09_02525 [Candidatus Uhrbacteria bacterium RIFCSPHIGHO2_02_FULL_47_44]|uniref:Uncharacterized protein n=1 Tax=Candidatus Uhrbacteria bacterium RIFCSPLOWO2_02_FULL_48_18 TaxID=1802408 RepID=A0A1F7V8Q8_9BACT|nr:MAG: hypothetical protein A2839_00155 [Candidatus Uhrbacteria bacterium RIFCSPHIGHO2_01_FULL_47_10]OGL70390.1 MAG: hypothetical protein A3C09_02525 [Candidatus Uhrbacteria bacterium RIFCSPHIGHO2_02_FULL_47_44]OGL77026.1 MAG: hypothetical protein A3E97_02000 [Candidatus Uhrbacteria bacterium RIFCSPHIGHO2_12_FULL_47_12]OGL82553.1 MAG: hypothetical protein A3B20_00295 [Candidatus Uhrbacteria bacterium RIFCSPLOWO2_01_FULL_47_17]OGL86487.1 MAG: hypothetical protein A3I41_04305 [Candidatus Uhrbact